MVITIIEVIPVHDLSTPITAIRCSFNDSVLKVANFNKLIWVDSSPVTLECVVDKPTDLALAISTNST